jgi:uncharacterized protein (DUF3084 family)
MQQEEAHPARSNRSTRKAKSEKRKAKSEKRKAKSEKRKAKSEKRKAKSEKRKANQWWAPYLRSRREDTSDFQKTSTGVNNSPTKDTRKSETSMTLQDSDVVRMDGLSQGNDSTVSSGIGWLRLFMDERIVSASPI